MRVNQLAKVLDTTADTVRFYTRIGLLQPVKNKTNGYKVYREADERRLRFALRARQLGFSVNDIVEIVAMADQGKSPCGHVRTLIQQRLSEIDKGFREVQQLYKRMHKAAATWKKMPDSPPTGKMICELIEAWEQ
jgi:DNA-binding transcriptional MerR regulator